MAVLPAGLAAQILTQSRPSHFVAPKKADSGSSSYGSLGIGNPKEEAGGDLFGLGTSFAHESQALYNPPNPFTGIRGR
jgi:hypothetical protein